MDISITPYSAAVYAQAAQVHLFQQVTQVKPPSPEPDTEIHPVEAVSGTHVDTQA